MGFLFRKPINSNISIRLLKFCYCFIVWVQRVGGFVGGGRSKLRLFKKNTYIVSNCSFFDFFFSKKVKKLQLLTLKHKNKKTAVAQ